MTTRQEPPAIYSRAEGADGNPFGAGAMFPAPPLFGGGVVVASVNTPTVDFVDADVRELADMVPHKMWFSGPRGGVLFLNARFAEYTGVPRQQSYGMGWRDVVHPEDLGECLDVRKRDEAIRCRQPWQFEYRIRRHDGEYRWHTGRTVPLFDAAGFVRRWVGTSTDIQDEKEAAQRQRRFMREVLASVTDGRLRLCDSASDLPIPPADVPVGTPSVALSRDSLSGFRRLVGVACREAGFSPERTDDLLLAAGEAAMNAVVHGGGRAAGCVYVSHAGANGLVQVWVIDGGGGIAEDSLHRATLERGYTTAGTLGYGFPLMLRTADRVYLHTGARGTSVVLEQERVTPEPVPTNAEKITR
ncbi:MAG: PAS domain-containing protein [Akkermansiaceae bacterium]|nr:PAS domain-containing protein [Armatimonadota bacterium]